MKDSLFRDFEDAMSSYRNETKSREIDGDLPDTTDLRQSMILSYAKLDVESICQSAPEDIAAMLSFCVGIRFFGSACRLRDLHGSLLAQELKLQQAANNLPLAANSDEGRIILQKLLTSTKGREYYRVIASLLAEARRSRVKHIFLPECSDTAYWQPAAELELPEAIDLDDSNEEEVRECV